uniref:LYR motif-containing protein 2 n=1 Tax=Meleagris gallopavo TaxID=9103 RepID=A0A803XLV9_MELGA
SSVSRLPRRPAGCRLTSILQFLRRQQVLQLYRRILRAIRDVPAEADRRHLQKWAREEFQRNKGATEEVRSGSWQSPVMSCALCCAVV